MKILRGLWSTWWRAQWRGTLGVALASVAFLVPRPAGAQFCSNCIYNQSALQTGAQFHVQTGTIDGTLTAGTLSVSAFNATAVTAGTFTGDGSHLTILNAAQLSSGTVPSARVAGSYTGITGVGTVTAGVWNGSNVSPTYGGLGENFSTVNPGSILYANNVGHFAALPSPSFLGVLQSTGTNGIPVWVSSPSLQGYNFTNVPLTSLLAGTLSTSIGVADGSLTTVSAAKIVGNITGGASFLTVPLPIGNLAAGTLPTTNAASSVTVTGVSPGTFGGPSQMFQARIGTDGRIYDVHQFNLVVPPPVISTGPLPYGVTIGAPAITSGTLAGNVVASSIAATGIAPGSYGNAASTVRPTFLVDGRASSAVVLPIALPLGQLNNGALPVGVTIGVAQLTPGTWPSNVPVSSVAASGVTAGICGGPATTCAPVFGADGRATSFTQYVIPGVSTASVLNNIDNAWAHSQTSLVGSSWTIHDTLYADHVLSSDFNGVGANISGLNPANFNPGVIPANVVASSVSIPYLVVPGSITAGASFFGDGSHLSNLSTAAFSGGTVANQTTFVSSVTLSNGLYVRAQGASGANPTPFGTPPGIFVNGNFNAFDANATDSYVVLFGTATNTSMVSLSTGGIFGVRGGDPTGVVAFFGTTQEQSLTGKQVVAIAASANDEAGVAFTTATVGGGYGGEVGYKNDSGHYRVFLRQGQQAGSFGSNKMIDVDVTAGKAEVRNMPLSVDGNITTLGDITTRFIQNDSDIGQILISTGMGVVGTGTFLSVQDSTDPAVQLGFDLIGYNAGPDGGSFWSGTQAMGTTAPAFSIVLYDQNSGLFNDNTIHVDTMTFFYNSQSSWLADPEFKVFAGGNVFMRSTATAAEFALQSGDVFTAAPNANVGTSDAALTIGAVKGVGTSTITFGGVTMAGGVDASGHVSNSALSTGAGLYNPASPAYRGQVQVLAGVVMGAYDHTHLGRVTGIGSVGLFGGVSDGGGGNLSLIAGISGGYNQAGQLAPLHNAHIAFQTGDNLGGDSISDPSISTRTTAGGETLTFSINGEATQTITLAADADAATICADIQAKIRALTAADPANQYAYSGFNAQRWPNNSNALALVAPGDAVGVFNGTVAGPSSLTITGGTFATLAGLGLAHGGTETSGSIGTYLWSLGQGIVPGAVDGMALDLNGLSLLNGNLSVGASPVTWYYCTGSTAGTYDGNLARGNSNSAACAGGTWVATQANIQ